MKLQEIFQKLLKIISRSHPIWGLLKASTSKKKENLKVPHTCFQTHIFRLEDASSPSKFYKRLGKECISAESVQTFILKSMRYLPIFVWNGVLPMYAEKIMQRLQLRFIER